MHQLTRPPSPVPPTPVLRLPPRMPAILDGEEAVSKWLDFGEVPAQEALKLIRPTENIAFHRVSSVVNSSWNNAPECVLPLHLLAGKVRPGHPPVPAELHLLRGASQRTLGPLPPEAESKAPTVRPPRAARQPRAVTLRGAVGGPGACRSVFRLGRAFCDCTKLLGWV